MAQLRPAHPGQFQQVVDEQAHGLRGPADPLEIVPPRLVQRPQVILQQGLAEAVDAPEGRPQVVRDGIAEGLQLLVGGLQLGCAFPDALLQFCVEPADFFLRPRPLVRLEAEGDVGGQGPDQLLLFRQPVPLLPGVLEAQDGLEFPPAPDRGVQDGPDAVGFVIRGGDFPGSRIRPDVRGRDELARLVTGCVAGKPGRIQAFPVAQGACAPVEEADTAELGVILVVDPDTGPFRAEDLGG